MALRSFELEPEFIQELLPVAEKTALLYHLSYLCLAGFPNLERIIRSRAVETQLLFGSSMSIMEKCIWTSDNLVTELFPKLLIAIDKNKPELAIRLFGLARNWMAEVIDKVNNIVEKYDVHNKDVASSTSDVIKEKTETEQMIEGKGEELLEAEAILRDLNTKLEETIQKLKEIDEKIEQKMQELADYVNSITQASTGLGIFAAIVPFLGTIIKSIYEAITDPQQTGHVKALETEIDILSTDKSDLRNAEWKLDCEIIDLQMKISKLTFDIKSIPDPVHLSEVQRSLTKIQRILIELKNFWENIGEMLEALRQKTLVGEEMIPDIADFKDEFVEAINAAKKVWKSFGESCKKASVIFHLQTTDAYNFLEDSPTDLSEEEWQGKYNCVKEQLRKFDPQESLPSPDQLAIEGPKGN